MASPPTVTVDTSTSLTNAVSQPDAKLRLSGGTPVFVSPGYRVRSAIIAATGGNVGTSNGAQASCWRVETVCNAAKVDFRVGPTASAYRIIVDGQYTNLTGYNTGATSGTTSEYIHLDFTSVGGKIPRVISIEGQNTCSIVQVRVGASDTISAPPSADLLRGIVVGDSYVYGSSAIALGDAWPLYLGDCLGIRDMWASGSGGTGWAYPASGSYKFGQRLADWTSYSPDYVFFHGSINDVVGSSLPADITAAVISSLSATRAALPNALIFVLGAFPAATGPSAATLANEAAVYAGFSVARDKRMAFIPVSADPDGAWISGTGYVGATNGSGNSDTMIAADSTHPTNAGHALIATKAADKIIATLPRM